jgi:ribose/xylose/arabinose/galactoside ABC-type transport system permease subunit
MKTMQSQDKKKAQRLNNSSQGRLSGFVLPLVVVVLLGVIALTTPRFFSQDNFVGLARQLPILGLLAIGITPITIAKGYDLSIGSVAALSIMTTGYVIIVTGSLPLALLTGIMTGAVVGVVNAVLVEGVGLNAVIVTLATLTAVRGLDIMLVEKNYYTFTKKISHTGLLNVGKGMVGGIPVSLIIFLVIAILLSLLLGRTIFGRRTYTIGNNEWAASIHGINTRWHKGLLYVLSGAIAGLSGIIALGRIGVVTSAVGVGWEFQALTAVIIGGTSLTGGIGSVTGTIAGVFIIAAIGNLMTLNQVSGYYQQTLTGIVIIIAVLVDRYLNKRRQE